MSNICPICGNAANIDGNTSCYIECPNCGSYIVPGAIVEDGFEFEEGKYNKQHLMHYMYYHNNPKAKWRRFYLGTRQGYLAQKNKNPNSIHLSIEEVENWYPRTFAEQVDLILKKITEKSNYFGNPIEIDTNESKSLFFINTVGEKNVDIKFRCQSKFFVDFLQTAQYIEATVNTSSYEIILLPKGWSKVYELQKSQTNNKDVFVAMSFKAENNCIREAIRKAIENAKYSPKFMDEIIHNHQIIPEMLRLIRESRFLIMDISDPNYGAYFEAGYALGMQKEVIITCRQDVFDKKDDYICNDKIGEDKKCDYTIKAFKPHFDIIQKQILVWDDEADLINKLTKWINSIIGKVN